MVVEIWSDLVVPTKMDRVRIDAIGPTDTRYTSFNLAKEATGDKFTLPLRMMLTPANNQNFSFTVKATGYLGNEQIVEQAARLSFIPGKYRILTLFLGNDCRGKSCDANHTCADGACNRELTVLDTQLPSYNPNLPPTPPWVGTGGAISTSGIVASGGMATGGITAIGGTIATGGMAMGGITAVGGIVVTGGMAKGGITAMAGTIATGGMAMGGMATGGITTTGGTIATGGIATGGITATGGIIATGGMATGGMATGGITATGGTIATGGMATGGIVTGGMVTGGMLATGGSLPSEKTVTFSSGQAQGIMDGFGWVASGAKATLTSPTCSGAAITNNSLCLDILQWSKPNALCITGSIPALPIIPTTADYDENWGISVGVNTGGPTRTLGQVFEAIEVSVSGSPVVDLRIQLRLNGDQTIEYCAPYSGRVVPVTSFNTKCWDNSGKALTAAETTRVVQVTVTVLSNQTPITVTDLCLNSLTFY
jgi:hypothetical protein